MLIATTAVNGCNSQVDTFPNTVRERHGVSKRPIPDETNQKSQTKKNNKKKETTELRMNSRHVVIRRDSHPRLPFTPPPPTPHPCAYPNDFQVSASRSPIHGKLGAADAPRVLRQELHDLAVKFARWVGCRDRPAGDGRPQDNDSRLRIGSPFGPRQP